MAFADGGASFRFNSWFDHCVQHERAFYLDRRNSPTTHDISLSTIVDTIRSNKEVTTRIQVSTDRHRNFRNLRWYIASR